MISFKQKKIPLEYIYFFASLFVLFIYLFPLITIGENLFVPPFDFLDITFCMSKILYESKMVFASNNTIIPNMMGGLPRFVYGSEFNYFPWLFSIFTPYQVYAINEILMHISAFLSMLLLLKLLIVPKQDSTLLAIIYISSLLFSLLPFFPGMGLSLPLLPLTWYLFLVIKNHTDTIWHWIILSLIPFFTNFVLVYLFVLILYAGWFLYCSVTTKHINKKWLYSILLMGLLYFLIDYRLIVSMFIENSFVSHRIEFIRRYISLSDAYQGAVNLFVLGQSHTITLQKAYIVPSVVFALSLTFLKHKITKIHSLISILFFMLFFVFYDFTHTTIDNFLLPLCFTLAIFGLLKNKEEKNFYQSLLFISIFSIWYGLWYYKGIKIIIDEISILKIFDFSRFALLNSAIWYVLLALSFVIYSKRLYYSRLLIFAISLLQLSILWQNKTFYPNAFGLNFKNYYDINIFQEIDRTISKPKNTYRVGSIGIPPAIALYNGFYTVDGYAPNYPLSYKYKFRDIIKENFKTNKNSQRFFEHWGSQCYIIAGDKNYKTYLQNTPIHSFKFNIRAFHALGGRYLFSGYKITNADAEGIKLVKKFHTKESFWNIWLYETIK